MALTTLTALKLHLGITTTAEDDFLTQLLTATEAAFLGLIDRRIESTAYVEYYAGNGTQVLCLREYPVLSIAGVWVDTSALWGQGDNAFASDTELTAGTDYALVKDGRGGAAEVGRLYRVNNIWPGRYDWKPGLLTPAMKPSPGTIKVSYTAGYATVPSEIPLALWQTVARLRASRKTGQLPTAEHYEEYGYQMATEDAKTMLLGSANQILSRYKRLTRRHEVLT